MATTTIGRCLSDLPDDLLRRILLLAPAKEAASTNVLSRRWRSLWRTTGAVYLDSRFFNRGCSSQHPEQQTSSQVREDFVHGAEKALAAAAVPIRRLTFIVAEDSKTRLICPEDDPVGAVLSNPAARRVEELRIEVDDWDCRCTLSFGSLPSGALRVLRIINWSLLTAAPPGTAFPWLSELHLQRCTVPLVDLLGIAGAAPQLATLHLESLYIVRYGEPYHSPPVVQRYRLICPAVTALVFADCEFRRDEASLLEIDTPRLQYLRYKGAIQHSNWLSLKSETPSIKLQVDLHLIHDYHRGVEVREPFWQFIQNFSTAKLLKLKLDFSIMDRIALEDKESQDEVLCRTLFGNLQRLELEAQYSPESEASMVIQLANLLHSCPVVCDLRLKLSKESRMRDYSIDKEARADFDKSVHRFRHHRSSLSSLGKDDDNYMTFDIPVLSEQSFRCLRSYLRRVSLHFCMDEPNCLGIQLAKFFAKKSMVLEELYIDDGSQKMCEHKNSSVRRWISYSGKKRKSAGVVET